MNSRALARIGAIVFVAIAITATAIELSRDDDVGERWAPAALPQTHAADPLRAELKRCQRLGEEGTRDDACMRAWAENRRRFLGQESRSSPLPPDASESAGTNAVPEAN